MFVIISIMNVDHKIRNQQILLNSLSMTPSPGVDESHSRGVLIIQHMCMNNYSEDTLHIRSVLMFQLFQLSGVSRALQ